MPTSTANSAPASSRSRRRTTPTTTPVGQRHGLPMIGVLVARCDDQRQRPRGLPRSGPLRRTQEGGRRPRCARPAGRDEEAQADGAALRAHRPGRRADAHRPVVRGDEQGRRRRQVSIAGKAIDCRGQRPGAFRARAVGEHLQPLDEQHPGLVHQPPALVGPPDPGLVRQRAASSSSRAARTKRASAPCPPATAAR